MSVAAGLGTKRLLFEDIDNMNSSDVRDVLYKDFPKLTGQGFELLRLKPNSTEFELIAVPQQGDTPLYLSREIPSAKIFVRPITENLSISPVNEKIFPSIIW